MSVDITKQDNELAVKSPYDKEFITKAKEIGGSWDRSSKRWVFDERDEDRVRELCMDVYGEDGTDQGDPVTLRLDVGQYDDAPGQEIRLAGRRLINRRSRDYNVQMADNVVVVEGSFKSSDGSRKNPRIGDTSGVVVEIRDVPPTVAAKMQEEAGDAISAVSGEQVAKRAAIARLRTAIESAISAGADTDTIREMVESFDEVPF